ncbi:PAS domain S-box protein [bacterium]|nr:PAS domain S-box protein [bacterium]
MADTKKTKAQLITELQELRKIIAEGTSERRKRKSKECSDEENITKIWETYEHSPIPTLVISTQEKVIRYNNAMKKLSGYSHREVPDREAWMPKLFPDKKYRKHVSELSRRVRQREIDVISEEYIITRKNGEERTVEFNVIDIIKDGKTTDYRILQGIDITERKRIEEALRESEKKFRSAVESNPDFLVFIKRDGTIFDVNRLDKGFTSGIVIGRNVFDEEWYESKDQLKSVRKAIRISKETGTTTKYEYSQKGPDGSLSFYETRVSPFEYDKKGKIISLQLSTRDITERKQAEEALLLSEEKFSKAFHSSPNVVIVSRLADGKILEVNDAWESLFEYSREEVLGESSLELNLLSTKDRQRAVSLFKKQGFVREFELEVRSKSGNIHMASMSIEEIEISGEQCIITTMHDITERKHAEEALRESEERYRNLFNNAWDGIFIVDRKTGNILASNPVASKLYGYSREELLRMTIYDVSAEPEKTTAAIHDGITQIVSRLHRKKDGTIFPVEITGSYFTESGHELYTVFIRDITKRKQAEETLKDSEEKYRNLFDNSTDFVYTLDLKGNFTNVNRAAEYLTGYTKAELIGMNFRYYTIKESRRKVIYAFHKLYMTGDPLQDFPFEVIIKDGAMKYFETSAARISKGNKIIGFQGISRDVTERKRVEKALREDKKKLRSLALELTASEDRERRRIAAYLHDMISQALVVIRMKLATLQELKDTEQAAVLNKEIRTLLEETIECTRSITFELSSPILDRLGFEPAVEWLCEKMAEDHGLVIDFRSDSSTKDMDDDSKRFLYRSTRELLMNVIKHACAGCVKVSVFREKGTLCITVDDDGVGFQEGLEDNRYLERGFGLFSIHERLDHLGGSMEIDSKPGRGTCISLFAPLGKKTTQKKQEQP